MACGNNHVTRMRAQVVLICNTFRKASTDEQKQSGFIGKCYSVKDRINHTIIVDTDYARIGYTSENKFYERISKGEWTTVPFVINPNDPTCQAIGKHLAIRIITDIAETGVDYARSTLKSGYYDDYVCNHMTGNVNEDIYTEGCTDTLNNIHSRVIRAMAKQLGASPLWYYPKDAKRNGKPVTRTALKFPLSINEIKWAYNSLKEESVVTPVTTKLSKEKQAKRQSDIVRLIAGQLIKVWMPVYNYGFEPVKTYPMHDELRYYKHRQGATALIKAHTDIVKEEELADYLFAQYEAQFEAQLYEQYEAA